MVDHEQSSTENGTRVNMSDHVWSSSGIEALTGMSDHVRSSPETRTPTGMSDLVRSSLETRIMIRSPICEKDQLEIHKKEVINNNIDKYTDNAKHTVLRGNPTWGKPWEQRYSTIQSKNTRGDQEIQHSVK